VEQTPDQSHVPPVSVALSDGESTPQFCECGCGQPAPIARRTNRSFGHVKGQPLRFILGHNSGRGRRLSEETRQRISAALKGRPKSPEWKRKISTALQGHQVSAETARKIADSKRGRPLSPEHRQRISDALRGQFVGPAHPGWKGEKVSYSGLHAWVATHKTKTGVCEDCGQYVGTNGPRGTQWANISGDYRRDLDDFRELCVLCHRRFDLSRGNGSATGNGSRSADGAPSRSPGPDSRD
jgi:hypothetical protein